MPAVSIKGWTVYWLCPLYQAHTIMILASYAGESDQDFLTLTSSDFLGNPQLYMWLAPIA